MPSQQGIFPKRSLGRNPKIDSFSSHHQTTPSESLDRRPTSLAMPIGPIGCHFFHGGLWGSFYLFSWAFSTYLFYFYLLLFPWACWLLFLPCWSTGLFTSVLGLLWPIYFIFTYCCAHGPAGCYSCYTSPLGFFPLSLGSHGLFTLLLPFVVLMGPLAVIPAILAHWVFYLLGFRGPFSFIMLLSILSSFIFLRYWAFFTVGPFVKNGYQQSSRFKSEPIITYHPIMYLSTNSTWWAKIYIYIYI